MEVLWRYVLCSPPSYSVTRAVTGTLEIPPGSGISYVKSELLTEVESSE